MVRVGIIDRKPCEQSLEGDNKSIEISLGSPFKAGKKASFTSLSLEHVFDTTGHSKETFMAEMNIWLGNTT